MTKPVRRAPTRAVRRKKRSTAAATSAAPHTISYTGLSPMRVQRSVIGELWPRGSLRTASEGGAICSGNSLAKP